MEDKNPNLHSDPGTYQTGRTQPPKHYSGIVAILLVLVILLSGIATALSIMNFQLYTQLKTRQPAPKLAFSHAENIDLPVTAEYHDESPVLQEHLGISGMAIPKVYQRYYQLPEGIYVTHVDSQSQAQQKGLVTGDIITHINDLAVTDEEAILAVSEDLTPGSLVTLTLYRSGTNHSLLLPWGSVQ